MGAAPLRALIGWVLVALTLLSAGCDRLGRPSGPGQGGSQPIAATAPRGALQEVAPPPLVQQLRARLDRHDPQIAILAPADGALLPAGPWTLELQVQDWPLVDAGPLGLGPHLVVQLDGEPAQRISDAAAARHLTMAPLTPGSHRLTVVAARPWGEVVKSPGASRQIRLDRVAANPQQLPAPGSPQLLAALASPGASKEPVLIDWLLLDAPLQHLRDDDGRWRLRVSVNGDSFLVDRQTPLWLKGFRAGSNAVQLDLLDGRGEPLNPPFNSLVEEVVIQPGPGPAWLRPSLTALEQAQLLGEAPLQAEPQAGASPATPAPPGGTPADLQPRPAADRSLPAAMDPATRSAADQDAKPPGPPRDQASSSSDASGLAGNSPGGNSPDASNLDATSRDGNRLESRSPDASSGLPGPGPQRKAPAPSPSAASPATLPPQVPALSEAAKLARPTDPIAAQQDEVPIQAAEAPDTPPGPPDALAAPSIHGGETPLALPAPSTSAGTSPRSPLGSRPIQGAPGPQGEAEGLASGSAAGMPTQTTEPSAPGAGRERGDQGGTDRDTGPAPDLETDRDTGRDTNSDNGLDPDRGIDGRLESGPESPPAAALQGPASPGPPLAPPAERPSPSPNGRARDQVAADGSLIKPRPEGPLARLRQRFQP